MVGEGAVVAAVEVIPPALTSMYTPAAVITIAATPTTIRVVHILKHIRNGNAMIVAPPFGFSSSYSWWASAALYIASTSVRRSTRIITGNKRI